MAIPTRVRDAVVDAYYPRALGVPDAARARAQAAYGIASAIAAALVAAGVFGHLGERHWIVQVLGIGALCCWLFAAGLFAVAVSAPFYEARPTQPSAEAFVYAALDAAAEERDAVDWWQGWARTIAALAAAVTVAALIAALIRQPDETKRATVVLKANASAAVRGACGTGTQTLAGQVDPSALEKEFVTVELDPGACGSAKSVAVPRSQIRAVTFGSG